MAATLFQLLGKFQVGKNLHCSYTAFIVFVSVSILISTNLFPSCPLLLTSLTSPRVPNVNLFGEVIGDAFALALVAYAISISLGKTFALKHGYKVDSNQVNQTHIKHVMNPVIPLQTQSFAHPVFLCTFLCSLLFWSLCCYRSWWLWVSVMRWEDFSSVTLSAPPCLEVSFRKPLEEKHK